MQPDRTERPVDAESTSSGPDETVDPDVAEADEGGGGRHKAEFLDDARRSKLGMTHEGAEHDPSVEDDVTPKNNSGGQAGPGSNPVESGRSVEMACNAAGW